LNCRNGGRGTKYQYIWPLNSWPQIKMIQNTHDMLPLIVPKIAIKLQDLEFPKYLKP
jgi:hypothetical protein